ncbi:MAG: CRTAC1 family protein [Gemmataceae bacterium]|nr:CRTAC1 family protein [Gemmataceae bacterium]
MRRFGVALIGLVGLSAAIVGCGRGGEAVPSGVEVAPPAADEPVGPPWFEDVTSTSGVSFSYRNGEDTADHLSILESLGGGLAAIDYDGDGLLDLYAPGGGYFAGPDKREIRGHPGKLYRNRGGFQFEDVTAAAGLETLADGKPWFYSHAAAVADYDRDGWPDLLVTGWGRVALFHNEPDGKGGRRFRDVSAAAGLDRGITWATSAAWADLDADGSPDLYVCQYVDWSFSNHPTDCQYDGKTRDVCPPKRFKGLPHKVYRSAGGGLFVDVSDVAGLHKGGDGASKGLGAVAVDVNGDGRPDVYVANDTVPNFLYMNQSDKAQIKLTERGMHTGVALGGSADNNGSMGVDAGDPEGTGRPALWVTNYENELHALYRNMTEAPNRPSFVFATQPTGIAAIGRKFVGWGTGFADLDHDGWEDLFVIDGHAIRYPTGAARRQLPVLLRNKGGRFAEVGRRGGAYFAAAHLGRGAVLADFDNDGRQDLAVSHINDPVAVLRNVAPAGNHWVGVGPSGAEHRDVVGARVVVEAGGRTQTRFAKGGGSYASSPDRRLVFGLGSAEKVTKLTVYWPDGTKQEWADVPADQYHVAAQGQKDLQPPARPKG